MPSKYDQWTGFAPKLPPVNISSQTRDKTVPPDQSENSRRLIRNSLRRKLSLVHIVMEKTFELFPLGVQPALHRLH
jgi:hypothetical protein